MSTNELEQLKLRLIEVEKHLKFFADNCECPEPEPPTQTCLEIIAKGLPTDGSPKPGGWGANVDPKTWKAVNMRDDPALFKVVDDAGINVAHKFQSLATAQQYIDYHVCKGGTVPPEPCPPGQHRDANGNCVPDTPTPTPTGATPYPPIGPAMGTTQRGPTVRHYASGKPDDQTIELNCKNIKFDNYQFVCFVTMHDIEHDDNVSVKLGGTHMGSGWFDHGVSFKGNTCLGKEEDHPSTDLCVVKGPNIGNILEKKLGIAGTYFKKRNHTELWTNLGSGWVKQLQGTNVGGFNPNSAINEAQLRIDGFVKGSVPTLHSGIVTEIAETTSAISAAETAKFSVKGKKVECDDD